MAPGAGPATDKGSGVTGALMARVQPQECANYVSTVQAVLLNDRNPLSV